jgi:hypothetical protein
VIISSSDSCCSQIDPPFADTAGAIDPLVGAIDPLAATAILLSTNTYKAKAWKEENENKIRSGTDWVPQIQRNTEYSMLMDQ